MARRQLKYEFNTDEFKSNLNLITQAEVDEVAHPDTLAYIMKKINPEELSGLKTKMITRLIRMRCLEKYRLMDEFYMIAVDMTGHVYFGEQRHCDGCSIQKREGKVYYRHNVLEAKLVTRGGMALSIETEFVENKNENDKQDCELSAFYRLVKRLKDRFPQLRICLLMDSLYANQQTFNICKESGWKYIVTFKSGSMPKTYQEAMTIKRLQKKNRGIYEKNEIRQKYAWASEVEHEGHKTNILECVEHKEGRTKGKRFVWATNLWITKNNYAEIANDGGRCRWKIENEGFNMQKNGGYNLKHVYCDHPVAMKNFYQLLQIAHFINQLMEKGSLLKEQIKKVIGGVRNFSRRLLEELRTKSFNPEELNKILSVPFQIRFDSS